MRSVIKKTGECGGAIPEPVIPCSYLRLSVTDRCSFNCFYCGAGQRGLFLPAQEVLSVDELLRLAHVFVDHGVRHIRLTGGEPLLRKNLAGLIHGLSRNRNLRILSLTTNGYLLEDFLSKNPNPGLHRLNISLDTLDRRRFRSITGVDGLSRVLAGIEAARTLGFRDIRLNVLLLKGRNDDEIRAFVRFAGEKGLLVRFIEYFPTHRRSPAFAGFYVPSQTVRKAIRKDFGHLTAQGFDDASGPAEYYRLSSGQKIGFISSVTKYFCCFCNRLRLTADGRLFPCLHADVSADLKKILRQRKTRALAACIQNTIKEKSRYNKSVCRRFFEMSSIGG